MTRVLHLIIKKKWFDLILSGEKDLEYREIKKHWRDRLLEKDYYLKYFDVIHFVNGYGFGKPWMDVEWLDMDWPITFQNKECFRIRLGDIIRTGNLD